MALIRVSTSRGIKFIEEPKKVEAPKAEVKEEKPSGNKTKTKTKGKEASDSGKEDEGFQRKQS